MVEARGYIGLGTTLAYTDDPEEEPVVWNEVARITEIPEIGFGETDQVDVTGYDTPSRTRESISGMGDPPSLDITGVFTADESQQELETMHKDGTVKRWQAVLPNDLAEIEFDAYVAEFSLNPQLDDRIEFSATLQLSGRPEMTVPSEI